MEQRMRLEAVAPDGMKAMLELESYIRKNLDRELLELIKVRASYINGCAYCIDMHTADAIRHGMSTRRLFTLAAWHESPFFTPKERTALALVDEVTKIGEHGVTDAVWSAARELFSEKELADIVFATIAINGWNRIAITNHTQPPTDPRR